MNDPGNCMTCGNACPEPESGMVHAIALCTDGCQIDCETGWGDCDQDLYEGASGTGCETQLLGPSNCGMCGATCTDLWQATATCANNVKCAISACNPPWNDCDKDAYNGCESNWMDDPSNCGACGTDCYALGYGYYCMQGKCTYMP